MRIYTKNGDRGETSLLGGERVPKDALRIEAYGTVDELNSAIGIARSQKPPQDLDEILSRIQNDLFILGADLAAPGEKRSVTSRPIAHEHVSFLETTIDVLETHLAPLKSFILPGGGAVAAQLHLARTICRRAERIVVRLSRSDSLDPLCIVYLNRLSDALFVLARYANLRAGEQEIPWTPRPKG